MSESSPLNRREFLKQLTVGAAMTAAIPTVLSALSSTAFAERRRGGGAAAGGAAELSWPTAKPGQGAAAAVNYVEDQKMAKADLKIDRQGIKFADQHCKNCGFYKEVGDKAGKKVGTCTIFAKQLVTADGWCASWNKK